MATVVTVPRDSALQLRLVVGTNPDTGAPIVNSKTFNKVKSTAIEQDAYDVANALIGLQKLLMRSDSEKNPNLRSSKFLAELKTVMSDKKKRIAYCPVFLIFNWGIGQLANQ